MVDGKGSSAVASTIEGKPIQGRRNRDAILKKLTRRHQRKDKKITQRSYMKSPSMPKEPDVVDHVEQETRDANSTTALESSQSLMISQRQLDTEQMIQKRPQNSSSVQPSLLSPNKVSTIAQPKTDEREQIDDNVDQSNLYLQEEIHRGQKKDVFPSNHLSSQPCTFSTQKDELTSNASFHVRISIGYMTGLKLKNVAKSTKQPINNRIVTGFVELASSGKYSALSQPLLTNVEENAKTTKILWATQRDGKEISRSKSRRRLHFSLSLDRENSEFDSNADIEVNSTCSRNSFVPEVVKLLVGLKCGDEQIPLGIAKFVVNGRETFGQKMDLLVLPGIVGGSKTKRGLFGKKQWSSFTNGGTAFKLAQEAKLRIKADIHAGYPGQDGAEIWGDDDSSYTFATKWTFDSGAAFSSGISPSFKDRLRCSTMAILPSLGTEKYKTPCTTLEGKARNALNNRNSNSSGRSKIYDVPMKFVTIDPSNELVSVMSDTSISDCKLWSCAPIFCGCGDRAFPKIRGSFSFESSHKLENEINPFDHELRTLGFIADNRWDFQTNIEEKTNSNTDDSRSTSDDVVRIQRD